MGARIATSVSNSCDCWMGFGEVGGEKRPAHAGLPSAERREQHERQGRAAFAYLARKRDAIHFGHVHVYDSEVERFACSTQASRLPWRSVARDAMPHYSVCRSKTRRLVALSSTTSMRLP